MLLTLVKTFVQHWSQMIMLFMSALFLVACGGGSSNSPAPSSAALSSVSSLNASSSTTSVASVASMAASSLVSASASSSASVLTNAQRINAATQTAQNHSLCVAVQPFYWEIGDKNSALASASVGGSTYAADTVMSIASASKWIFAAYIAQLRAGQLTSADIASLTMRAGYTNFGDKSCVKLLQSLQDTQTVNECFQTANPSGGSNSDFDANAVGHFSYDGGHFQKMAVDLGLGSYNNASLQAEVQRLLGTDFVLTYTMPQPAGGVSTSSANYAIFLRKILNNQLHIHDLLGSNAVCTNLQSTLNNTTCTQLPLYTPAPNSVSFNYSLGHWLEDDPIVGDDAFSSAGTFGFYPWIDATKAYYGVLARKANVNSGFESIDCGRLIRKAWVAGMEQ